jgi:hypothetical protein
MTSQGFEGVGGQGDERDGGGPARSGDEVAGYAAEVRAQFADLSDAESAELLEDLEDHLSEVAAEDAGTLRERLGAPAAYARDLRQAAGLPEPSGKSAGAPGRSRRSVRHVLADAERWARGYRAGREVLDFLPSLRPAWWVLRAWVAVRLLEAVTTSVDPWHEFELIPRIGDSTFAGLLALLVAIPASVYAARQTVPDGWRRRAMGAGEGILVLFTVGMALSALGNHGDYSGPGSRVSYVQQEVPGLSENGRMITNLYVYDQSGRQLDGALVYDQDGRPVSVAPFADGSTIDSGGWLDGNGTRVPNAFPQQLLRQQWDGTGTGPNYVAVPPPVVAVPQGVHRASAPTAPQGSATPSVTPSATPTGGATGAHPSSALPSTPQPSSTTG